MPKSRKRYNGPTPPRQIRIRQVTPTERMMFVRGMRSHPEMLRVDIDALDDALNRLASQNRFSDLLEIQEADTETCVRWADRLAAENLTDTRWDAWRSYRRAVMSDAN